MTEKERKHKTANIERTGMNGKERLRITNDRHRVK